MLLFPFEVSRSAKDTRYRVRSRLFSGATEAFWIPSVTIIVIIIMIASAVPSIEMTLMKGFCFSIPTACLK